MLITEPYATIEIDAVTTAVTLRDCCALCSETQVIPVNLTPIPVVCSCSILYEPRPPPINQEMQKHVVSQSRRLPETQCIRVLRERTKLGYPDELATALKSVPTACARLGVRGGTTSKFAV